MEPNNNLHLLIISLLSLLLYSTEAVCVPRNFTYPIPSPPSNSPPPTHQVSSPPPNSLPPTKSVSTPPPNSPPPPPTTTPTQEPVSSPPLDSHPSPQPVSSPPTHAVSPSPLVIDPAIKAICTKTDNPELCLSSIIPYLTGKVDPISILEMEIKACTNFTQVALAEATRIAKDPSTPSYAAQVLEDCKDSYDDAVYNLQSACDAIPAHDIGTINSMLSAALTDFQTCEEGFLETPGRPSPMADFDDTLSKLASNCLAITTLI